jgi:hypothetical protein
MSNHSFLLKGWGVTLVAALFALAAKDANAKYILIAFLPILIFLDHGCLLPLTRAFLPSALRKSTKTKRWGR